MALGIFFSVLVSILFSVYAVPRKFSNQNAILYTMWTGVGYLVSAGLVCAVVFGIGISTEDFLSPLHWLTVLRGVIWVLGIAAFNSAIDKIGLTRFNQWKNFQGPVGSILILTLLSDVVGGTKITFLVSGMVVMFVSALLFTIKPDGESSMLDKKNRLSGVLLALFAACCFGVTAYINSYMTKKGFVYTQLLYQSVAIVVSSAVIFVCQKLLARKPKELLQFFEVNKKTLLPISSGIMYLIATTLTIFSYKMIANSVAWSITQLNAVWTILIGLFVFKEVKFKEHRLRIILGFLTAISAMVLLFFAL